MHTLRVFVLFVPFVVIIFWLRLSKAAVGEFVETCPELTNGFVVFLNMRNGVCYHEGHEGHEGREGWGFDRLSGFALDSVAVLVFA